MVSPSWPPAVDSAVTVAFPFTLPRGCGIIISRNRFPLTLMHN